MDGLPGSKDQREIMQARIAEEHARQRLRFHERIDFLKRLDRNGKGTLVPVIRRRSAASRMSGDLKEA